MSFVPMKILLDDAYKNNYAVPAFCAWNAEIMLTILRAAERLHAPVILMQGPGEFPVMSPEKMASVARAVKSGLSVPAALHLDHGDTISLVEQCLGSGYTSVMLDYSTWPYEENIAALKQVVRMARPRGVTVEGELGHVGKADDAAVEGSAATTFTDPVLAGRYVESTGVDALAVSIGNRHGFYRGEPKLDFDLLSELRRTVAVPMVLHGGTGIPASDIKRAASFGMAKVNVASDLVHGFRQSLSAQWSEGRNLWSPEAIGVALQEVEKVVEKWLHATGAAGRA